MKFYYFSYVTLGHGVQYGCRFTKYHPIDFVKKHDWYVAILFWAEISEDQYKKNNDPYTE